MKPAAQFSQAELAGVRRPSARFNREYIAGDRVVCRDLENCRLVFEVTSVSPGAVNGRPVLPSGKSSIRRLKGILCREGEPECAPADCIHGDLLYYPEHKSGLQYAQVVATRSGGTALCRWNETAWAWTKPVILASANAQYWGHISEPNAFARFIARIEMDMQLWEAATGRSRWAASGHWVPHLRVWNLGDPQPSYINPSR